VEYKKRYVDEKKRQRLKKSRSEWREDGWEKISSVNEKR